MEPQVTFNRDEYATSIPRSTLDPLTRDDVAELADGTIIEVIWAGGNGPHRYLFRRTKWGQLAAWMIKQPECIVGIFSGMAEIGVSPLTEVRLIPEPETHVTAREASGALDGGGPA